MDRIDDLLEKTSRTFALSIPLLPEPTRRELGVAYLLFRIADTFEDAADWTVGRQTAALHEFVALLEAPSVDRAAAQGAAWAEAIPIDHAGYQELLRDTGEVFAALAEQSDAARRIIVHHTVRTTKGMAEWVERTKEGILGLDSLADLRAYCYTVAGIVGELSTDLFLLDRSELDGIADSLRGRAPRFGEALQLVNILKDSSFDVTEGRRYLPSGVDPGEVFALAREDLGIAAGYTNDLQAAAAPRGVVAFCALPVRLAYAALDAVERQGPGSKITRDQVYAIVASLNEALDAGEPAVPLVASVGRG